MILIDAHCHLESHRFDGCLERVVDDARNAGVAAMITAAIVPGQWERSSAIARQFPEVECAWGVHPWYIQDEHRALLDGLLEAKAAGAVAIGEIGLDSISPQCALDLQVEFFETQLGIAREVDLPVVVHCRGAFEQLARSIKKVGMPGQGGVIHNFPGSAELARQLSRWGFSFSLGGVLTYRNSRKKVDLLRAIYPDRFLLETDSPDIPPVEAPGGPNVPANIVYNLRAAAELLECPEEEVAQHTTENAVRLFGFNLTR